MTLHSGVHRRDPVRLSPSNTTILYMYTKVGVKDRVLGVSGQCLNTILKPTHPGVLCLRETGGGWEESGRVSVLRLEGTERLTPNSGRGLS